jgi:outer membrane protein OmpA-like peptidoglycan-associated protein
MEEALIGALPKAMSAMTIVPFVPDSLPSSRLLITGNIKKLDGETHLVKVALTDRPSGQVIAQSAARFDASATGDSPTPFYRASRAVLCDQSALTEIETSEKNVGEAANALYLEQLSTSALLERAQKAFDTSRWQEAYEDFRVASTRIDGKQLKTYAGMWTSQWNLGRIREAEGAYGEFARHALATNTLNVMLLFPPNRWDVFDPPRDAEIYAIMIRQIARTSQDLRICLEVAGHTSRTGSDERNLTLSRQRAEHVARSLVASLPDGKRFEHRPEVRGVGSAEVLNGAPVDDDSTAIDRRVQFKVVSCGGSALPVRR